jgi:hypothetical protein
MNVQTRPKVVSELKSLGERKLLPYVTRPSSARRARSCTATRSPRRAHADGCNDDVVMAWGIALELYAQLRRARARPPQEEPLEAEEVPQAEALYPWA